MKKYLPLIGIVLMLALLVTPALAQNFDNDYMAQFQNESGIGSASMAEIIGKIVKAILSVLGLVALVIFIIAGFQWMTSGGNKEKIQGAQKLMGAAVIGLVIVIIAYAATHFIISSLAGVTNA
ncbi:hypothetical protein B6D52_00685 [Candidatus Parcubacteria bacterium 4484_255]|nr:MAG: hypothetical protein B6D52_00685 [Candidatus Parcubacteria bacterium 4484_255]